MLMVEEERRAPSMYHPRNRVAALARQTLQCANEVMQGAATTMSDKPSFWGLATRSSSIRIGAGLVGLGLLFVIFVGLDAIEGRSSSSSQGMLWVAACFALLGGVLVAIGVRRGRARWRVADEGLSTEATVTAVTQSRMQTTAGDAPSWMIRYRYQDTRGQSLEGHSGDLIQEEAENWEVGDTAMIRFDGRRPGTSAWIGERSGSPAGAGSKRHAPQAVGPPPSLFRLAKRVPSFWIGPLFFIFGVMVVGFVSGQLQYEDGGDDAQGTVLGKSIERAGEQGNTRYWVYYRFATRQGQVVQGTAQVSVTTWESMHENDPVRVQYLRDNPMTHRLYRRSGRSVPIIGPGIYLLPGLLLFLAGLRRVWIWHRLVGHGVRATGTVSAVKRALFGSDWSGRGVSEWQRIIQYLYEDDLGQAHQGRSGYLSSAEASRWRVGDRCNIRVDRERPARSVWIGAVEGVSEPH
jgi:Protein of unknown function (DUF3592)